MHGGDVYRNKVNIDFSVNINPLGVPENVRESLYSSLDKVECYPDISCEKLRDAIAEKLGICYKDSDSKIICSNGSSEMMMAIVHATRPKKAVLFAPSFSGYEKALRAVDCEITYFELKEENDFRPDNDELLYKDFLISENPDMVFLCNPSNPVGNVMEKNLIMDIVRLASDINATVVLDECFIELSDSGAKNSFISELKNYPKVIVLRAFTKSFALPGIRLGYAVLEDECLIREIKKHLPEWNVSVVAQEAGVACLLNPDYLEKSRQLIRGERKYLVSEFEKTGIPGLKIYPSDTNYILFKCDELCLFEKLLDKGILIRDCRDYKGLKRGFYRIAVRNHEKNEILIRTVKDMKWN